MIPDLSRFPGIPDRFIESLNERFRQIRSNSLIDIGTPGVYPKVTTDAKGRVIAGGDLEVADLPPGVPITKHDAYFSPRSAAIAPQVVSSLKGGRYLFCVYVGGTTAGAGTIQWSFGWESGTGTRNITSGTNILNGALLVSALTAVYMINIADTTDFGYSTNFVAPGGYEFAVALTLL